MSPLHNATRITQVYTILLWSANNQQFADQQCIAPRGTDSRRSCTLVCMDDRLYTSGDIIQLFDISRQSARQYAIEFADYLSPSANPAKGSQRNFSALDMGVYAMIVQMKKRGATYEQIHMQLKTGARGDVPSVAPIQAKPDSKRAHMERQLVIAHDQISTLQTDVLRKDAQIEVYQQQVARLEKRISDLDREIGQLQASQDDSD